VWLLQAPGIWMLCTQHAGGATLVGFISGCVPVPWMTMPAVDARINNVLGPGEGIVLAINNTVAALEVAGLEWGAARGT
jgi:hypothetical protein